MDKLTKADLYRYNKLTGFSGFIRGLKIPGFRYMYFTRMAFRYGRGNLLGILSRILLPWLRFKYGFQIPICTSIGEGFFIGHFGTIVINSEVRIGRNCNIAHGVTIGQANRGEIQGSPTIGNRVWIGTGSVIVGKINIGSDVLIAPNCFINFDVPDNSLVIGNPGIIHKRNNPTKDYINNIR